MAALYPAGRVDSGSWLALPRGAEVTVDLNIQ